MTLSSEAAVDGPASGSSDIDAVAQAQTQAKYDDERKKRVELRPEGNSQYINLNTSEKFKHYQDDPWIDADASDASISALTDGSQCKYLIVGAGFGGLLFAVRLIQAGIKAEDLRLVDDAGGFGGTWYWNRYPGLMCDTESYIYMPLLEEMDYMPKHKYSYGTELREYAESIAEKWQLRDKTMFRTQSKQITWDDKTKQWVVNLTQRGSGLRNPDLELTVRSQFVILASGLLHNPKLPGIPGIDKFRGHSFHTSRWDYSYTGGSPSDPALTNLKDKKVGIIGTGATAIQAVPHLAKWAKELYVFQRTPSSVDKRDNRPTDTEWWNREIRSKGRWQRERQDNFNARLFVNPPAVDLVSDGWTNMRTFQALIGGPNNVTIETTPDYIKTMRNIDFPRQERIRLRVEEIVKDKGTAEKLKPWYTSWCKRPCFHDDYLPSFNLPNVKLVDTDAKGIDRITDDSAVVGNIEYQLDLLIFSTGYKSPGEGGPGARANMLIIGRDNKSLDQKFADGVGTLHGVISHDFPNFFIPGPLQTGASANQTYLLDQLSRHVAYIISQATRTTVAAGQSKISIEPTLQAEEEWASRIASGVAAFAAIAGCTPSYINGEGHVDRISSRDEGMRRARGSIWSQGILDYVKVIEEWRAKGGLQGLEVTIETLGALQAPRPPRL